jgi:hypothetical protein
VAWFWIAIAILAIVVFFAAICGQSGNADRGDGLK